MEHSKVAAVRVTDYAAESVAAGIAQALALLGGLEQFVQPGDRVLLKPNLLEGVPMECAVTTHPEVLRAVIRQVKALGAEGINIQMISTSEIKISVVIEEKYLELAVRVLHKTFGLENGID